MSDSSRLCRAIEFLAATNFGQFLIRKLDWLLWTVEKPAKYAVDGECKNDTPNLSWPVFWILLIYLRVFRVVLSTIMVQFNKAPVENREIVTALQTWRRTLRSIRFRGLRTIRERQCAKKDTNGDASSTPPKRHPSKKRPHDEGSEYDLNDLVNRSMSDRSSQTDSTFMATKLDEENTTNSSNFSAEPSDEYPSPPRPTPAVSQEMLPAAASDSNVSTKSNESTFVSTIDDTEASASRMTEDDSMNSPNADDGTASECEGAMALPIGPRKVGKESLNVPADPVDAMMYKLAERESSGKHHVKKHQKGNKKKRHVSWTSSQGNGNRQLSMSVSRSQESINKLD